MLALEQVDEVVEVVLAYVVAGKEHMGGGRLVGRKVVGQCLDHGLGAKIAAAYAYGHHILALAAQRLGGGLNVVQKIGGDAAGQVQPAQEVVAQACALFQLQGGCLGGRAQRCHLLLVDDLAQGSCVVYLNF